MLRESTTSVIERNRTWCGRFETEPWEAGWATEAIIFIRVLAVEGCLENASARVQISPDGMVWCDEGTHLPMPTKPDTVTFARVSHFGGWLRITGELPDDAKLKVIVYLALKG